MGVFEFAVVPFGMKGSPATTVQTIRLALKGIEGQDSYVDDIMVHTDENEDHSLEGRRSILRAHEAKIREVLTRLRDNRLFVKREKDYFFADTMQFVGYEVQAGRGVTVSNERVSALLGVPIPTNATEARR